MIAGVVVLSVVVLLVVVVGLVASSGVDTVADKL
jgi:hypothetical protein